MKKRFCFFLILTIFALRVSAQMYILNEDFNGASGTTPPSGWNNIVIQGGVNDKWHFDNPGHRILYYPITEPFAIFDSDSISANGVPEVVALETPVVDASTSNYILLYFVQVFEPGIGGTGIIEAYDGDLWQQVVTFSVATSNPSAEIVDLSPYIGGITNAKLRFKWSGNGSGFWALDNIRIYASLPVDGGVVSIDSPNSPVVPGPQNVEITLGNFGYNTLTTTKIDWTANGVAQPQYTWNGSIGFGQTASNIIIGTYNFQDPVMVTVWQSFPNGQADLNPYNDTVSKYLVAALCGTYTIGGTAPDFVSLSQAADILNIAGVNCPVTFLIRDGTYLEQFELRDILGASETNTITFRSESGDSTKAIIKIVGGAMKYEPMIYLNGSSHIYFRELGLATGSNISYANSAVQLNGAKDIHLEGCYFEVRNQFDFGIGIHGGSQAVEVRQNRFESISARAMAITISGGQTREIDITGNLINGATDWGNATVLIDSLTRKINFAGNHLERCYRAMYLRGTDSVQIQGNMINNSNDGIYVDASCSYIEISGNRLSNIKSHQSVPEGTSGIYVKNCTFTDIFNNFIHTKGDGPVMGISLENTETCRVCYNSINVTNSDMKGESKGILLSGTNEVYARNNIFRVRYIGTPVYIELNPAGLDFDKNDYYSIDKIIGYFNGNLYYDLPAWRVAVGMDVNSLSVMPFYSSDTILNINQALLNNSAVPIAGISDDIDGNPRDPVNPDIGAKEYDPCTVDAGINSVVSPENPLAGGIQAVTVLLQNQGTAALSEVLINWSVNGQGQAPYPWTGNLPAGTNSQVTIGNFDFQAGILYTLKAWTSSPNNGNDCDYLNDTITSQKLAVPLCGNYTIGGSNPDFATVKDAVTLLNLAGITCPVTLSIRNGTYREKLLIKTIPGTSAVNTVTFQSESGDSTKVILQIVPEALKYESMIYLENASHLIFKDLGMFTGSNLGYFNNAIVMTNSEGIRFEGCNFEVKKESDLGIGIQEGCHGITIKQNRFASMNAKAVALNVSKTREINIEGNNISGATEWLVPTIRIGDDVRVINLSGNLIENCYRAIYLVNSDSAHITGNIIKNTNDGIYIDNWCSDIEISGNRLSDIKSHANANDGTSGIFTYNVSKTAIFNNYVHTSGDGPVIGINVQNSSQCKISFNSVNITNEDLQSKSKGFNLKTCTGTVAMNNIFTITNSGTPVYVSSNPAQIDLDHNDYFGVDKTVGYFNGTYYSDLATWKDSTNMDENSLAVIPFFTSVTDLSINQALLNDAGIPVTGITADIDGTVRDPVHPDIGAKEYNPCANDAGINKIVSPESPLFGGTQEVRVILQNQGTTTLSSAGINWSVNDELQTQYAWSGNLGVAANTEVLLGTYDFQTGRSYSLKVWTSGPNSGADCNHLNDTISSGELAGPLCGTYTIGGSDPDFATVSQAAEVLNTAGVTCAVTFLVRDGIYHEKFILMEIAGASPENIITFRSESNDSSKAVIEIDPTAVNYEPMILMDQSQFISFQSLGLITGSSSGIANIAVELDGAKNITLEHCNLQAKNTSDFGVVVQGGSQAVKILNCRFDCPNSGAGAINIGNQIRDVEIGGNVITGSTTWGNTLVKIGNNTNLISLTGNNIERSFRSVYAIGADSVIISDNTLKNTNSGIYLDSQCSNVQISGNYLINVQSNENSPEGTIGILVQNSTGIDIVNNFIQTAGAGPSLGISLQSATTCKAYYNSINITNTDAQGKSKGIYMKNCTGLMARNNIYNIKSSGLPIHIDLNVTNFNFDYNDYYNPAGIVGKVIDQVYSNIFTWGQTINGDANSKAVNPYFKADTIPLPFQRILNGAGIPVAGIIYDIQGKIRNPQAPDIGCFEFFVDYGILELLSPTLNCFQPDVDSVRVYIRQYGDVPFDNLKVAYQLDNGPVHQETIPGPLIFDITYTFSSTETISAPGEYLFKVWLINTLDDNINNDTLKAKRYSKPPPVVSIGFENQCTGWEVHFSGQATVVDPYFIDKYEWFFGDGDTSHVQNPVHEYQAAGTYDVVFRAYSDAGCYSETTVQVTTDPDFQGLDLTYNLVNETCAGDGSGSLELVASGGNPPYTYYLNGAQTGGSMISGLAPGKYEIRVVDSQNCSRADSVESVLLVDLNPQIFANPLAGNAPLTVSFSFTANGERSWIWHFPGEIADSNASPTFTFNDYGTYVITLEVGSGQPYFCTDTATVQITVDVIVSIEANSVFTPNGDGYNDFFEIKSYGIIELKANIFNQWGNEIYVIDEVNGKWDGLTKSGAEAADGTYFYVISAKGINNLDYDRQGSVLLLRHGSAAFPNPVTGKVTIKTFDQLDSPVTVEVYSVFGQLAYSESINDPGNLVVDISHLASGIYILKATDGTRSCYARIIKD